MRWEIKTKLLKILVLLGFFVVLGSLITTRASAANPETIQPSRQYVVTDDANILSTASKNHIIDQERQFQSTQQQPQIVVLTVDNTDGLDMAEFTNQLTQRKVWQSGKAGQDNGVLIVFAKNNGQNNVRIAPGSGVESVLPDGKTILMLKDHEQQLKSSDPAQVNAGLRAVFDQVAKQIPTTAAAKKSQQQRPTYVVPLIALGVLLVSLGILAVASRRSSRRGYYRSNPGTSTSQGFGMGGFWPGLFIGSLPSDHHSRDDWYDDNDSGGGFDAGSSESDFTDSGGGGDFGGGGSDI